MYHRTRGCQQNDPRIQQEEREVDCSVMRRCGKSQGLDEGMCSLVHF